MPGQRRIKVESSPEFRNWLVSSSDDDKELKSRVRSLVDLLKSNAFLGEQIPRRLWPRGSILYREINNLYRLRVTDQARIIYTVIAREEDELVVRVLEFFRTHSEYDKRFGYD